MAKESREPARKAKVRLFDAEVEGDDDTIKDGLQSLATALVRAMQPPVLSRPKQFLPAPALSPNTGESLPVSQNSLPPEGDQLLDSEFEDDESPEVPATRPKSSRVRKARSYTVVADLNLHPDDKQSLVDFYRSKAPSDQQEQIAVFLYYLSRLLGVTPITDRHLYTCYKEVSQRVPPEILQVARNTANRKGWIDTSDGKSLRLTVTGENYVEHSLPKAKTNDK